MSERGLSTALDAVLCLLLVSAAVVALVSLPADTHETPDPPSDARSLAATLAASTASVEYDDRAANGTRANLLADVAVLNARNGSNGEFERGVRAAVEDTLNGTVGGANVSAFARREHDTVGAAGVGPSPPSRGAVSSAAFSVPADAPSVERVEIVVRTWSP